MLSHNRITGLGFLAGARLELMEKLSLSHNQIEEIGGALK